MVVDPEKPSPLLNLLSREPGTREEKQRWLEKNLPLIEAEADASFPDSEPTDRAYWGKVKALVIRFYRKQSQDMRPRIKQEFSSVGNSERMKFLEELDQRMRRDD